LVQTLYLVVVVFHVDILKHTNIFYSTRCRNFWIESVTVCAGDWLLFVLYYIHILCDMTYVFNYVNRLRFIQVEFSRQRCFLSRCTQKTLWRKLQGIADGHIPLPMRQCQQVRCLKSMDRQNHPIITRTFSKTHNYYCPLTRH
jgi:hypothetical protein